jgi:hypothetical protein
MFIRGGISFRLPLLALAVACLTPDFAFAGSLPAHWGGDFVGGFDWDERESFRGFHVPRLPERWSRIRSHEMDFDGHHSDLDGPAFDFPDDWRERIGDLVSDWVHEHHPRNRQDFREFLEALLDRHFDRHCDPNFPHDPNEPNVPDDPNGPVIPEPATSALLLVGLGGAAMLRRARHRLARRTSAIEGSAHPAAADWRQEGKPGGAVSY